MVDAAHPEAFYSNQGEVKPGSLGALLLWEFPSTVCSYAEMFYILFFWLKDVKKPRFTEKELGSLWVCDMFWSENTNTMGWCDNSVKNLLAWQAWQTSQGQSSEPTEKKTRCGAHV